MAKPPGKEFEQLAALIYEELSPNAVVTLAQSLKEVVERQDRYERGLNLNSFVAYVLFTILLGNSIVLIPMILNAHAGTKYGVSFPVLARASFGVKGANIPAMLRAIVACGWFGINTWIGGQALQTFFRSLWAGWPAFLGDKSPPGGLFGGHYPTEWISFLLFWALNILIVYRAHVG